MTTACIILAAGASTRLTQPKQTLRYNGKSLLQHAAETALQAGCRPVIVITGAFPGLVAAEVAHYPVSVVHNPQWQEGMGASIRCGVAALEIAASATPGVVLMCCDQPFIKAALLLALIERQRETGKSIIASYYNEVAGVPALFSRLHFKELLELNGKEGARRLFSLHRHSVEVIPFPLGAVDIDTWADYALLQSTCNE